MKLKLFQGQNSEPQEYLKLKNKENESKRPESGKKIRIGVSVERPNSAFHKILARKIRDIKKKIDRLVFYLIYCTNFTFASNTLQMNSVLFFFYSATLFFYEEPMILSVNL